MRRWDLAAIRVKCLLLCTEGHLYAIDVDPIELPRTRARLAALGFGEDILSIRQMNFSQMDPDYT